MTEVWRKVPGHEGLDENKTNNHIDNLEDVTHKRNMERLAKAIEDVNAGKATLKEHELIEVD